MKDAALSLVKYAMLVANTAGKKTTHHPSQGAVAGGIASTSATIGRCIYAAEAAAVRPAMLLQAQVACEELRFWLQLGIDGKIISDKEFDALTEMLNKLCWLLAKETVQ